MSVRPFVGLSVLSLLTALASTAMAQPAEPAGTAVLDSRSLFRWRVSWRKPVVPVEALRAAGKEATEPALLPIQQTPFTSRPDIEKLETAPPPAEWVQPDFNDRDWPRDVATAFGGGEFQAGQICLRGKFHVADPAAVTGLTLSAGYRGGLVVYLNGKEVARGDMPDGPLTAASPAKAYGDEAWVDAQGKMLPNVNTAAAKAKAGDSSLLDRINKRERKLTVQLPKDALRKGVNVLAVAVHRADYHPVAMAWFSQANIHSSWRPIGLTSLTLSATGGGLTPNIARPAGTRVFNLDIHQRIGLDYWSDPNEPLAPIRISAARNGTFAGTVAIASDKPLEGVTVKLSDLVTAAGNPPVRLPASAVKLHYALLTDTAVRHESSRRPLSFDGLSPTPPEKAAADKAASVQPLWLRLDVPKDAAAGDYTGTLTVSAAGAPAVEVPIQLRVADWTLPDARQFRTHAGVYQSPTCLSLQYKVPEWSEAHWKLMDQSFALLGRLGNKLVNVLVVEQTQFGNDEGMVYFVRKADGTLDYDFTVFDRYIELVKKHLGTPTFAALQVWHSGGWEVRKADQKNTVTVIDPKTRQRVESLQVPTFATEESKKFWTPLLGAIKARLAKAGMDQSICLGILSDGTAPPEVFTMFAQIMPEAGWMRGCHTVTREAKPYVLKGGGKVVYHEFCYGMSIADPAKSIPKIHDLQGPGTAYFRSDFDDLPPLNFRLSAERALYQSTRGFGRNCLDFWDITEGRSRVNIYNRFEHSSVGQREPTVSYLACAGPDGPLPTVRFELLLIGMQEAEAMIVISEALDKHAGKLGADLAKRCRDLLVERVNYSRARNGYGGPIAWDYAGWLDRSDQLFDLAGQVSRAVKGP